MKTCPFCKVKSHYYYIKRLKAHRVMCINRKCKIITVSTRNRSTKEEAIADWDERGDEVPDCPKCHVAHYPNCEQQGKAKDTPELKITGQDRTMCPYKICLKEKCEFYPNDCSVIRAHKREVEP